ncbi:anti-sigma factor family protein [Candidatus Leptofilum sp.]|uniref:anti-sigma factor family protein n=1 Tax=Candidatus Leptofilum sp. TaxID=3241576 RepID=UPI003B59D438
MKEFDEDLLHEYLDGTLDEQTRQAIEAHLANSPEARARLAELEALFSDLDALPELPLATDLSARVVAEIGQETAVARLPRWLWGLMLGQVAIALLLLGNVWSSLLAWWGNGRAIAIDWFATLQLSTLSWLNEFWAGVTAVWQQPALPNLIFDLPTAQWALLFGLALVVWLAGNRLMFTSD